MSGSPKFKVFNPRGEYVAACKLGEDAACLAGMYGEGAKIKYDHSLVLWNEGAEEFSASESYDGCARAMEKRLFETRREGFKKAYGYYPEERR